MRIVSSISREIARVERERLDAGARHAAHLAARHGADLAQVLGHDEVGREALEQLGVDGVERLAVGERSAHRAVDLVARERRRVDARRRDDGNPGHLGRVVAFVRAPDEAAGESERRDDLGRARDEGNDAHASSLEGTFRLVRYLARTMTNVSGMTKKLLIAAVVALASLPVAAYAGGLAPGPHASFTVRGANIQDPTRAPLHRARSRHRPGSADEPGGHVRRQGAGRRAARRQAARRDGRQHRAPRRLGRRQQRRAPGRDPQAPSPPRARRTSSSSSPSAAARAEQALTFVSYLAAKFHKDRSVWLQPAFDPSCDGATADRNRCISWSAWRAEQQQLVHAIRDAGMHSPILLSTPRRSGDLRLLAHYHLTDKGIVYGVHFHGGPRTKLTVPTASAWASSSPARARASSRSSSTTSPASARAARVDRAGWSDDFTAFVANWTINARRRRRHRRRLDALRPGRACARAAARASRRSARRTPRASSR